MNIQSHLVDRGPNAPVGKHRRKFNAIKHGIFSSKVLLPGESREEYESLWNGLRKSFQPVGTTEDVLVEKLAVLFWRERRFVAAERAEIEKGIVFGRFDSLFASASEEWDLARAGESSGGMLRNFSNRLVIQKAIVLLTESRDLLERLGFERNEDPWRLRKLYGLDHNGKVPSGIYRMYELNSKLATGILKGEEPARSPDELKEEMIEIFSKEIERLESLAACAKYVDDRKSGLQSAAALVPAQGVLERLLRYGSHVSREIERTLSQLDRVQRARLGKPMLPRLVVDINAQ